MKRWIVVAALAGASVGLVAGLAGASGDPSIGTGERLVLVIGGEDPSYDSLVLRAAKHNFSDMQGFYFARSETFEGFVPGRWLLVSAFRTKAGAAEFDALARAAGAQTRIVVARYLGTSYIGLGQESHPDGTGPLLQPLPDGHPDKIV